MKSFKLMAFAAIIAVIAIASFSFRNTTHNTNKSENANKTVSSDKGFAVVELFTSEGCSSCPPADALVAKIEKESADQPVYILAYHVDYWNRNGWKDVFSSHAYSQRQYQYSNWLKLSGVYTPQAVVNGQKEFVGSEESNMRQAIKNGLQNAASGELHLMNVTIKNNQVQLQYHTTAATGSQSLVLAIVQKAATTQVKGGENGGRTLSHVQIVRNLQTVTLQGKNSGNVQIDLPAGLKAQDMELVAFLQNNDNGEITSAAKSALPI